MTRSLLINVTQAELARMVNEFDRRATCTCPRCGVESEPWSGMWCCPCGAGAVLGSEQPEDRQ